MLNNRITDVAALIKLSRRTQSVMMQIVTFALGSKALFVVTTVLVTAYALRLLRWRGNV